jgi:hypothetical protein
MYREQTESVLDSGWRFFSGAEGQDYADNPDNFALYDVNTIANYDLTIIPYLDQPVGIAWGKNGQGNFEREHLSPNRIDGD